MAEKMISSPAATHSLRFLLQGTALIVAGLAGNYFHFPLFLNIDFIFGSIFSMLALQFLGTGAGILTAAAASAYTFILWNHPYAIIIMTAEAAVVGFLTKRRNVGIVLADTLYWLFIGMPLVYFFYHLVMQAPLSNTSIVMVKQAINGIANCLIARLIFTGHSLWTRSFLISYRGIIYNLLAFFVLAPTLLILAAGSRTDFSETDRGIRDRLLRDTDFSKHLIETWVMNRTLVILNLAELAEDKSPQEMQSYLEAANRSDTNFLRILSMNKAGVCTAVYPLADENGHPNLGKNFSDRPYIPELKETLRPMLSEVVMARIGSPMPIIMALAPVVIGGEYGGYIAGTMNLKQIEMLLAFGQQGDGALYTLIDKNGHVIMTSRTDQTAMMPFIRGKGTLRPLDDGIHQWIPDLPKDTPVMEQWKQSFYVAESDIGLFSEWKLILEIPVAPFQKMLYDNYTRKLVLVFFLLIGALALAEVLSLHLMRILERLHLITQDLTDRLSQADSTVEWPDSGIKEAQYLIYNFRKMAASLTDQFNEIRQINMTLAQRVAREVDKTMTQERMLIRQSRLAAMGEMIGNIAHQWRQPLNALGLLLFNIQDAYQYGTLDAEFLDQTIADGNRLVRKMSTTISDFSNFFRPDKEAVAFSALEQVREAVKLVTSSFQSHHLAIHIDAPADVKLLGFPNEYSQVLLNLLSNAKDALLTRRVPEHGKVEILFTEQNGRGCVHVRDNGGGIPEAILDRVFDPYFSTKEKGSGIGLYMSKMIIENNMNGSITAKNIAEGAEFTVSLPLAAGTPDGTLLTHDGSADRVSGSGEEKGT